jgi:hypothetical protein
MVRVGAGISVSAGIGVSDNIGLATGGAASGEKEGAMIPAGPEWIKGVRQFLCKFKPEKRLLF